MNIPQLSNAKNSIRIMNPKKIGRESITAFHSFDKMLGKDLKRSSKRKKRNILKVLSRRTDENTPRVTVGSI